VIPATAREMTIKGQRLHVDLGASQVRRRLKGHGFGVRRVETAGKNRAFIIHTATGEYLRRSEALFHDVIEAKTEDDGDDRR
jgi:DNA transformation protein and related proteins